MPLFDFLMTDLLEVTESTRTTMRVVGVDGSAYLLSEARAGGDVPAMNTGSPLDPRAYPTYRYLEQRREILVQNDTRTAPVAPPPDLISVHHVYAQMLAPIVVEDCFAGTISVHHMNEPREWLAEHVDALSRCQALVEGVLTAASRARLT